MDASGENMSIYKNKIYWEDLQTAILTTPRFEQLRGKSVMITGATGLIGSFLVDMLLYANKEMDMNITIYAMGRRKKRLEKRFEEVHTKALILVEYDINQEISFNFPIHYLIHAAGNAYPAAFREDPVGTIIGSVAGTKKLLDYSIKYDVQRFLFVSTGEIYGQGSIGISAYQEDYSGYVDSMQSRSCYPCGKRAAETLCVSYTEQYGLNTVIVRPCHTYGANVTENDNRATVQFINNAIQGKDIVLNSSGMQLRSYCYVADCASGLLTVLLNGEVKNAYNISNPKSIATIADFARETARQAGKEIIFINPDKIAIAERSPISKQVLDSSRLQKLGWKGQYSLSQGISHTLQISKNKFENRYKMNRGSI